MGNLRSMEKRFFSTPPRRHFAGRPSPPTHRIHNQVSGTKYFFGGVRCFEICFFRFSSDVYSNLCIRMGCAQGPCLSFVEQFRVTLGENCLKTLGHGHAHTMQFGGVLRCVGQFCDRRFHISTTPTDDHFRISRYPLMMLSLFDTWLKPLHVTLYFGSYFKKKSIKTNRVFSHFTPLRPYLYFRPFRGGGCHDGRESSLASLGRKSFGERKSGGPPASPARWDSTF
ncbi:hypothetical protein CDAR_78401 [Caerostris darwini]|uniref:Uncharacterized protein n=1 Tax=Caerostris darwini TaxID=1538125 RepID=A0AAV4SE90_9ARAC|nr:hypothetical protein CDAR_78401 [Caerostris darwini]